MKLTKSKLEQIIKEEMEKVLYETLEPPSKTLSGIGVGALRGVGSAPVPSKLAAEPQNTAEGGGLKEGEYNIRGQYLVYRLNNQLMTMNLSAADDMRHWELLENALEQAGWRYNEDAPIPVPPDYEGVR